MKHRLVNQRDYLLIIAKLKTSRMKSPRADNRELNWSILSQISKLSESFRSESQARPEEKPRIKMDLSLYPKIPGKNWTITKAAFISIASAHGLDSTLFGLPDDASEAVGLNHKSNCKLMYSALMLASLPTRETMHGLSRGTIGTTRKESGRIYASGARDLGTSTPGTNRQ